MSWFRWLSPARKHKPQPPASVMPSSGLSRLESTRPFHAASPHGAAQPANRKHERMQRREQLYGVVREAMVRASLLSSSYKFKVLSLDPGGRQFLVMVDLAHGAAGDTTQLAEIEAMIAQTAKARFDIVVTAVYWRANEHVAVGDPLNPSHRMPLTSRPAPLTSRPAPLGSRPAPLAVQPAAPAIHPVPSPSRPAPSASRPAPQRAEPHLQRGAPAELPAGRAPPAAPSDRPCRCRRRRAPPGRARPSWSRCIPRRSPPSARRSMPACVASRRWPP